MVANRALLWWFDGLVFWSVRGDISICSPDLSVYPSILLRNLNQSLRRNIRVWSLKWKTFESFFRLLKRIWSLQEFCKHLREILNFVLFLFLFYLYVYQIQIFQNTKYQLYTHLIWLETWRRFKLTLAPRTTKTKKDICIYTYICTHTQN